MSLIALIIALLIEQVRPLAYAEWVFRPLTRLADALDAYFNTGSRKHGMIAWLIGVLSIVTLSALLYILLHEISPLLGLAFNVLVLYLTFGFRQFSHYYTDIQLALRDGDIMQARALLNAWQKRPTEHLSSNDIARLAIEEALGASHRHVFGVLLWFVLLPGPCGAVLYRVAAVFAEHWQRHDNDPQHNNFSDFAQQAFAAIEWLPLRVTAAVFAIVGNFEDAVYCWRTQAQQWTSNGLGIVLASGAGALGVKLGRPIADESAIKNGEGSSNMLDRPELGTGEDADIDFMQSAVGLVWRAVVLWILLLLLLELAAQIGN